MALSAAAAAAIGSSGAQAAGGIIQGLMTARQNRKSQLWQERMYERQVDDQIRLWNMQNEYNDPSQQMQRLKEAGLNPHLVYGKSSGGAAGNASAPARGGSVGQPQFNTPEYAQALTGGGRAFMNSIYDFKVKDAQVSNLNAQTHATELSALLTAAKTDLTKYETGRAKRFEQTTLEGLQAKVRNLTASTDIAIARDERQALLDARSFQEAGERILSMRAVRAKTKEEIQNIAIARQNMQKDGVLKGLDIIYNQERNKLYKMGIGPNDNFLTRALGSIIRAYSSDPGADIKTKLDEAAKDARVFMDSTEGKVFNGMIARLYRYLINQKRN